METSRYDGLERYRETSGRAGRRGRFLREAPAPLGKDAAVLPSEKAALGDPVRKLIDSPRREIKSTWAT